MDKITELIKKYREIIMYIVIGVCTTAVNWLVYTPLAAAGADLAVCNALAWSVAAVFAFFTNKLLVFDSKDMRPAVILREGTMFIGSRVISGIFEIFLPSLLVRIGLDAEILGIRGAAAKLVTSVIIIVMNYVFSKLIVFRKKDTEGDIK